MKEFISILISFIFMGVAESIDSAFNNAISIDAIVVCGSNNKCISGYIDDKNSDRRVLSKTKTTNNKYEKKLLSNYNIIKLCICNNILNITTWKFAFG